MTQEEVRSTLGEPNKINYEELDWGIVYYFNDKLIKTTFEEDYNFKLFTIEVFNSEVIFLGQRVIGQPKEKIEKLLNENGYSSFVYEDYDTFDTFFYETIYATFYFEFDRLRSIMFSPLFIDDNNIAWPKRNE
jgi:hypothetical protein